MRLFKHPLITGELRQSKSKRKKQYLAHLGLFGRTKHLDRHNRLAVCFNPSPAVFCEVFIEFSRQRSADFDHGAGPLQT